MIARVEMEKKFESIKLLIHASLLITNVHAILYTKWNSHHFSIDLLVDVMEGDYLPSLAGHSLMVSSNHFT